MKKQILLLILGIAMINLCYGLNSTEEKIYRIRIGVNPFIFYFLDPISTEETNKTGMYYRVLFKDGHICSVKSIVREVLGGEAAPASSAGPVNQYGKENVVDEIKYSYYENGQLSGIENTLKNEKVVITRIDDTHCLYFTWGAGSSVLASGTIVFDEKVTSNIIEIVTFYKSTITIVACKYFSDKIELKIMSAGVYDLFEIFKSENVYIGYRLHSKHGSDTKLFSWPE